MTSGNLSRFFHGTNFRQITWPVVSRMTSTLMPPFSRIVLITARVSPACQPLRQSKTPTRAVLCPKRRLNLWSAVVCAEGWPGAMLRWGSRLAKRENVYCQDLTPLHAFVHLFLIDAQFPP